MGQPQWIVQGRVTDEPGTAIAGAGVTFEDETSGARYRTKTDKEECYRMAVGSVTIVEEEGVRVRSEVFHLY